MSDIVKEAKAKLPSRKAVYSEYSGPRKGLGDAQRLVTAWVGTYFEDRVNEVTICFAKRPTGPPKPDETINVEVRFDLDAYISEHTKLPPGLNIKPLPEETVVYHQYEGPANRALIDAAMWMADADKRFKTRPGFRYRMVKMPANREDTAIVETQLVLEE
jgi:hypothetical protein